MDNATGLAEALLELDGFRVLDVEEPKRPTSAAIRPFGSCSEQSRSAQLFPSLLVLRFRKPIALMSLPSCSLCSLRKDALGHLGSVHRVYQRHDSSSVIPAAFLRHGHSTSSSRAPRYCPRASTLQQPDKHRRSSSRGRSQPVPYDFPYAAALGISDHLVRDQLQVLADGQSADEAQRSLITGFTEEAFTVPSTTGKITRRNSSTRPWSISVRTSW